MAAFKSNLKVERVPGTDFWQLLEPFTVEACGESITVPAGTKTDFASVPRLPIMFLLFGGRADCSAAVHDYLYGSKLFPREMCDNIFYELMIAENVPEETARAMYEGVRIGGESHYGT